ncbi:hypothetical protein [Pseudoxanthomonas putridarboris]|uniref:PNPLA domain-containing protein n=1 Tax=Pseudoxanthomonas putridarboris TaxID=752605 RepID=A0ABU9J020_9GAMM
MSENSARGPLPVPSGPDEASQAPDEQVFASECDLVMKGGITSGVVYPLAIVEIAKAFRLRSIGGTSAGAIAAGAAAAAELGRQRHQAGEIASDPRSFDELARLPDYLGQPADSGAGTRLLAFFKPKTALRPVFRIFTRVIAVRGVGARLRTAARVLLAQYRGWALAVAAVVLAPVLLLPWSAASLPAAAGLLLLAFVLALAVALWRGARVVVRELPLNAFGVCSGMPEQDDPHGAEALTCWLSDYFDRLAGQSDAFAGQRKPLTFGDLKRHGIELRVMTTCLTLGRPFQLPFGDDGDVRENGRFVFDPERFRELFPAHVVEWMRAHPRAAGFGGVFRNADMQGFHPLPSPDDLPVIVAVRMSLSFPLLLSAVPLHSVDVRQPLVPGQKPQTCWFTDGGVGSNFPIHFFDAPLPTRPTFGLDLGTAPEGGSDAPSDRVSFPDRNSDASFSQWKSLSDHAGLGPILGFLGRVFNVAKDWNHEALANLPGFRDRIGQILLSEREGGLNLTMDRPLIQALTDYGRHAGLQFVRRFGDPRHWSDATTPSKMDWDNHQHIRLRLLLASTSEMLKHLKDSVDTVSARPAEDYRRFFQRTSRKRSYALKNLGKLDADPATGHPDTQAGLASWLLEELLRIASVLQAVGKGRPPAPPLDLRDGAPRPPPELKPRPRI